MGGIDASVGEVCVVDITLDRAVPGDMASASASGSVWVVDMMLCNAVPGVKTVVGDTESVDAGGAK